MFNWLRPRKSLSIFLKRYLRFQTVPFLKQVTYLQCTMVGTLVSAYVFLASLVAVTNPTNKATFGMARSFHEVNRKCETSRGVATF